MKKLLLIATISTLTLSTGAFARKSVSQSLSSSGSGSALYQCRDGVVTRNGVHEADKNKLDGKQSNNGGTWSCTRSN